VGQRCSRDIASTNPSPARKLPEAGLALRLPRVVSQEASGALELFNRQGLERRRVGRTHREGQRSLERSDRQGPEIFRQAPRETLSDALFISRAARLRPLGWAVTPSMAKRIFGPSLAATSRAKVVRGGVIEQYAHGVERDGRDAGSPRFVAGSWRNMPASSTASSKD
jgi:hypothetical protein